MHQLPHTLLKLTICTLADNSRATRLKENVALENARAFRLLAEVDKENPPKKDYVLSSEEISNINYDLYQNLRARRVLELRRKARQNLLAYGFLRGLEYSEMEAKTHEKLNERSWNQVERIIFDHLDPDADPRDVKQKFEQWLQEAKKVEPLEKKAA